MYKYTVHHDGSFEIKLAEKYEPLSYMLAPEEWFIVTGIPNTPNLSRNRDHRAPKNLLLDFTTL